MVRRAFGSTGGGWTSYGCGRGATAQALTTRHAGPSRPSPPGGPCWNAARELFIERAGTRSRRSQTSPAAPGSPWTRCTRPSAANPLCCAKSWRPRSPGKRPGRARRDHDVARVRDAKGARKKIETYVAALAEIQLLPRPGLPGPARRRRHRPRLRRNVARKISDRRARNMRAFAADLRATGEAAHRPVRRRDRRHRSGA